MSPIVTLCDSAGMADVWLGMAPSWYPLGPPRPLKTPQNPLKTAQNCSKWPPSDSKWLLWSSWSGLVWHHHEFLIITRWSLMDFLKPPKNGSKPQKKCLFRHFCDSFYVFKAIFARKFFKRTNINPILVHFVTKNILTGLWCNKPLKFAIFGQV